MKDYKKWTATERNRSLALTRKAKALGLIPHPKRCCFCGQENGILHHHNIDYDVTLDVQPKLILGTATEEEIKQLQEVLLPVCWTCHMMIHRGELHPKSAEAYFEQVKNGMQPKPIFKPNAWRTLDKYMID